MLKVRDDQGYWNGWERYIKEHSEATFSYGVCPECLEQLRGGFYSKNNDQLGDIFSQHLPAELPKN